MKKIILVATILVLFASCTVNKQTTLSQQSSEISNLIVPQAEQVTLVGTHTEKENETRKDVGSSATVAVQEKSNKDYNTYRYEERKIETEQYSAHMRQVFLTKECNTLELQKLIDTYNVDKRTEALYVINSDCNCPEVIDFAIDLINTSPDKEARKIAIRMLGFRLYYDAIPLLLNHVKKEISPDEKIMVAGALASLGKKSEASEILDCNCYNMDDMADDCIYTYVDMFDKPTAMKYFEHYFNKPETQLEAACWLAICGIYDKTFPLFVEFLENNTTYSRGIDYSLCGLVAIGTDEALDIIKQQTKHDTYLIARSATLILENLDRGRRKK